MPTSFKQTKPTDNRCSRELTVIDGMAMKVTGTAPLPATSFQLAPSPDGKYFHAVASGDNTLVKIDTTSLEVVGRMPVGPKSMFFAIRDGSSFPATEY